MSTSFALLTQDVITLLRQVAGSSVQTYSEGLVQNFVNKAFNMCHKKAWWPPYMRWATVVLDETTGVITTDLTQASEVVEFDDLRAIWHDQRDEQLTTAPGNLNVLRLTGATPLYIEGLSISNVNFASRVFRVLPVTSEGTLYLQYRFRDKPSYIDDDTIYLDADMLAYAAAYLYLKDDGSVPDMVDEYKQLFDTRFRDLIKGLDNKPIRLRNVDRYPNSNAPLTEWTTR